VDKATAIDKRAKYMRSVLLTSREFIHRLVSKWEIVSDRVLSSVFRRVIHGPKKQNRATIQLSINLAEAMEEMEEGEVAVYWVRVARGQFVWAESDASGTFAVAGPDGGAL
jgi:hypothetical protein